MTSQLIITLSLEKVSNLNIVIKAACIHYGHNKDVYLKKRERIIIKSLPAIENHDLQK